MRSHTEWCGFGKFLCAVYQSGNEANSSEIVPDLVSPATSLGLIDILVVERMEKGRPVLLMIMKGL
jgi:hypothetical protein